MRRQDAPFDCCDSKTLAVESNRVNYLRVGELYANRVLPEEHVCVVASRPHRRLFHRFTEYIAVARQLVVHVSCPIELGETIAHGDMQRGVRLEQMLSDHSIVERYLPR
eukprot:CAMPEP_0174848796 /NCGR_PEP_ID=MMETSP1114-20130205/13735_1 /TAXON_ID=312471 /ORGANISM="Neobodo designis, Strain CCAP 1951/1" /LENGTH=108 /DNA_ID=CAMNT_0016083101 /DNA_START=68 /DNA_END=394 /DNA_ORIENTATION=-